MTLSISCQALIIFLPFPLVLSPYYTYTFYVWGDLSLVFHWDFIHIIFMWVRRSMFNWEMSLETLVLMRFHVFGVIWWRSLCLYEFIGLFMVVGYDFHWFIMRCLWVICLGSLAILYLAPHSQIYPTLTLSQRYNPCANLFDLVRLVCSVLELDMTQSPWFSPIRCLIPDSSLVGRFWAKHEP